VTDFAYAYYVDDKIGLRRIIGVDLGYTNLLDGETISGVISLKAARRLGEQLLSIVDERAR
jgi:hypothetical protein